jgi:hypothetical protein
MRCRLIAPAHPNQPEQWDYPECVNCGCDFKYRWEMKRLDDGSWRCADLDDCQDFALEQEFIRYMEQREAESPGPKPEPVVLNINDPDDPVAVALKASLDRWMALKVKSHLHYLAWTGVPGGDWSGPPSLTCRERSSVRRCRESARFRRLRACVRACPSDGPPAAVAALGAPVISP